MNRDEIMESWRVRKYVVDPNNVDVLLKKVFMIEFNIYTVPTQQHGKLIKYFYNMTKFLYLYGCW